MFHVFCVCVRACAHQVFKIILLPYSKCGQVLSQRWLNFTGEPRLSYHAGWLGLGIILSDVKVTLHKITCNNSDLSETKNSSWIRITVKCNVQHTVLHLSNCSQFYFHCAHHCIFFFQPLTNVHVCVFPVLTTVFLYTCTI